MSFYNDNAVPFGSRVETLKRGGTSNFTEIGEFVFENISLTLPSKIIERPNQIGEPNGWVATNGFGTGTAVLQIATESTEYPRRGDWFEDTFNIEVDEPGIGSHWVIVEMTAPFEMGGYHKCNVSLRHSINAPAT
jgi:hypothetical protein